MQQRIDKYLQHQKMKRGGATIDRRTKEDLKANKVRTPVLYHAARQYGEKKKFYSKSIAKRGGGAMSLQRITDMLCPIFSYKRIGFGNSWAHRAHNHLSGTYPLKAGTVKSMIWSDGNQYWNEFIGLPLHNFGGTSEGHTDTFTYDGFHASISELIGKAMDIRNDSQSTHITRPTGTSTILQPDTDVLDTTGGTPSKDLKSWNSLCFDYLGGYQEHTFVNTSENMVTIFLQEAQPREVMSGLMADLPNNSSKLKVRSIGRDLLVDYKSDLPLANAYKPQFTTSGSGTNNASTDELSDPCVKINKRSNLVHRKYLISKEEKVTLAPGDTYTHRMNFPAFNFTESTFNMLASTAADEQSTSVTAARTTPMLIPMFTKILIVRAKSELGFGVNAGRTAFTGVGQLPGSLIHTCTEKHTCRMLPYSVPYQTFVDYNLDGDDNGGEINEVMNNETNRAEQVSMDGIAEL